MLPEPRRVIRWMIHAVVLFGLALYVWLGAAYVPEHGDEYMLVHMAGDYFNYWEGNFGSLAYTPPLIPDTDAHLRLLNGTVTPIVIGFALDRAGYSASDLPGIYAWAMPQDWNIEQGNVPDRRMLLIARSALTLFTAASVFLIFGIVQVIGSNGIIGQFAAWIFALHPAILLNGRRAMMENALFFFSLLTVFFACILVRRWASSRGTTAYPAMISISVIIGISAALTIGSKHTGVIVVGACFTALIVAAFLFRRVGQTGYIGLSMIIMIMTLFAINPAYWRNPVDTLSAMLNARSELLSRQTAVDPARYDTLTDRVYGISAFVFTPQVQYYESATWDTPTIRDQIAAYENSGWTVNPGGLTEAVRAVMTVILTLGFVRGLSKLVRVAIVPLIWVFAACVYAFTIPLAWGRYYLPVLLPVIVVVAFGLIFDKRPAAYQTIKDKERIPVEPA